MDIKTVIHINEEYKALFEPSLQGSDKFVNVGTEESENILVFFTGRPFQYSHDDSRLFEHNEFRLLENNFGEKNKAAQIQLKFHQSKEIPHFFEDDELKDTPSSLSLDGGVEYFIDVIPHLVKTTRAFQEMPFQQRKCKLKHEVEKNSIFKVYTQKNCKYECNIKKAEELCNCISWDFLHQNSKHVKECDIFGRTCFYNAMKMIAKSRNYCNHCVKECDYTRFDGIITKEQKSPMTNQLYYGKFDFEINTNRECQGEKVFCDFFWPDNTGANYLIDNGLNNSFQVLKLAMHGYEYERFRMARDTVVVHYKIKKPDIQVIDAKYSILDKFANFGGNFGIFAEITGCSFLGMVNFLILLFKFIFPQRKV